MKSFLSILTAVVFIISMTALPVLADWDPGNQEDQDKVKMHYPQLPSDLSFMGIDVLFTCTYDPLHSKVLADDWQCTEDGYITDIHFWFSALGDWFDHQGDLNAQITRIHLSIHSNDPGPPSQPDQLLWSADFAPDDPQISIILYDQVIQGWFNPNTMLYLPDDHTNMYQCNIAGIPHPFHQEAGTIYWLDIYVETTETTLPADSLLGWKTAGPNVQPQFMDDAVFAECDLYKNDPNMALWVPMVYPPGHLEEGESIDMAFVVTSVEIPTLSQWGLIILVVVLVTAGILIVRRRRQALA